jgi:hypothetical protein
MPPQHDFFIPVLVLGGLLTIQEKKIAVAFITILDLKRLAVYAGKYTAKYF